MFHLLETVVRTCEDGETAAGLSALYSPAQEDPEFRNISIKSIPPSSTYRRRGDQKIAAISAEPSFSCSHPRTCVEHICNAGHIQLCGPGEQLVQDELVSFTSSSGPGPGSARLPTQISDGAGGDALPDSSSDLPHSSF